ncbi:MAG: Ig domain-containing protein, partial [Firmicutes bacterium]|nr:Ig domain-containing protein [Bacillota bacterium]
MEHNKQASGQATIGSQRGYKKLLLGVVLLLVALFFVVPTSGLQKVEASTRSEYLFTTDDLKIGDYIRGFGQYSNQSLDWRVIAIDDQGVMLRTERVLTQANGYPDLIPFSNVNEQIYGEKVEPAQFASRSLYPAGLSDVVIADKAVNGTNFWDESTARYFLNGAFYKGFSAEETDRIVQQPQRKQMLEWAFIQRNSQSAGSNLFDEVESIDRSVEYWVDHYLGGDVGNGAWYYWNKDGIDKRPINRGNFVWANNKVAAKLIKFYNESSYAIDDQTVFLAPTNFFFDSAANTGLDELKLLRNPIGGDIRIGVDGLDHTVDTWTDTPVSGNSNNVSGSNNFSVLRFSSSGGSDLLDNTRPARDANTAYQPSIYLKKGETLRLLGEAQSNRGEVNKYKDYEFSTQVKVPPQIQGNAPTSATVGVDFSYNIRTNTDDMNLVVSSGELPDGLTLDSDTKTISGKPTKAGQTPIF